MTVYKSFEDWLDNALFNLYNANGFKELLVKGLKENIEQQKFLNGKTPLSKRRLSDKNKFGYTRPNDRLIGSGELLNGTTGFSPEIGIIEAGWTETPHKASLREYRSRKRRSKSKGTFNQKTHADIAEMSNSGGGNLPKAEFLYVNDGIIKDIEELFIKKFE